MSDVAVASSARQRSASDAVVRRFLHISDAPARRRRADVHGPFSISIVLSGSRCLLTYLVLPLISPLIGAATTIGPAIGIPLGLLALGFDVRAIRRFWLADHRLRWAMTWLYVAVMALVASLIVGDIVHLAS